MKFIFTLFLLLTTVLTYSQIKVDQSGSCGGTIPCYTTIQAGINAAAPGQTVTVYPGNYTANITINKSVKLESFSGAGSTIITGVGPGSYTAPIMITGPVNNVTIGGSSGHGFTILGIDNASAGVEAAAIILGENTFQSISNVTISYNTITAQGEAGLLTYYSTPDFISNLTIEWNIFNGKTFTGANPAAATPSGIFSHVNTAKNGIAINLGAANTNINNNYFSLTTGAGTLGNAALYIISTGSTIALNDFATFNGGTKGVLDVRGTNASITCNRLNLTNRGTSLFSSFLQTSGTAPYTTATVAAGNTFLPAGYISGSSIITLNAGTAANSSYPAPGCLIVLPLNFTGVNAMVDNGNQITVAWKTANEFNNSHFIVEQSTNGITYTAAATIASKGNGGFSYTASFSCTTGGIVFIRVKQVNANGSFSYSDIVKVKTATRENIVRVLNNPARGTLLVAGIKANTPIRIYNTAGALVTRTTSTNTAIHIAIDKFATGLYLLAATNTAGTNSTLRFVVQ
jgi:hypothetical protein